MEVLSWLTPLTVQQDGGDGGLAVTDRPVVGAEVTRNEDAQAARFEPSAE
jgi:hypothetical protein